MEKIVRSLSTSEATEVHNFNLSLGSKNKGFYRWYEDTEGEKVFHFVEYNDKDFKIEYNLTAGKLKFTGNVAEIEADEGDLIFEDE